MAREGFVGKDTAAARLRHDWRSGRSGVELEQAQPQHSQGMIDATGGRCHGGRGGSTAEGVIGDLSYC